MNVHVPQPTVRAIASRAMLAGVKISSWSGRKLDKSVTDEVNRQHGAAADAGRYNKALVSRDALAKIVTLNNLARAEHYARTLPWADDGARILPAAGYLDFMRVMRQLSDQHRAAVAEFVDGYSDYVEAARKRLNGMFKASDYPPAGDIAACFRFETVILPMPTAADFRVDVADAEADQIRADIQARTNAAIRAAMADVFGRVCESVGHMAAKLAETRKADDGSDKAAIFRDSLVENVRELVALLPGLNVTADAALDRLTDRMRAELLNHDADALRDDPSARAETAKAAASIAAEAKAAAAALAHVSDFMA